MDTLTIKGVPGIYTSAKQISARLQSSEREVSADLPLVLGQALLGHKRIGFGASHCHRLLAPRDRPQSHPLHGEASAGPLGPVGLRSSKNPACTFQRCRRLIDRFLLVQRFVAMAKRVQVVLSEDVLSLGKDGDLVEVAPGYARNFLLPTGKALPVTPAVLRQVEHRRAKEAERQAALKAEAIAFRTALDTIGRFTVKKQTGGDDVLFGTVTNGDVAEAIETATKKDLDRRDIIVPEIHRTGTYKVQVKLHPEVVAEINLEVVSH